MWLYLLILIEYLFLKPTHDKPAFEHPWRLKYPPTNYPVEISTWVSFTSMLEIVEEYVILTLSTYFNNDLITNRKKQPLFIPFKLNLFFGPNRGTMVPNTAGDVINIQHYCCLRCKLYLYGWLSICLFFDEQIVLVQIESLVCNILAYQVSCHKCLANFHSFFSPRATTWRYCLALRLLCWTRFAKDVGVQRYVQNEFSWSLRVMQKLIYDFAVQCF